GLLRVEHLNHRVADLDVATAAEFLETDMAFTRPVFDRWCERSVVPLHLLFLLAQVQILNRFVVQNDFEMITLEFDVVAVPLRWLIDLLFRRNGAINSARQL